MSDSTYTENLFKHLVDLLGETEESVPYKRFKYNLKDTHIKEVGDEVNKTVLFKDAGIQIDYLFSKIAYIKLFVLKPFSDLSISPYFGDFPWDKIAADQRNIIKAKLSKSLIASENFGDFERDFYDMTSYRLSCNFVKDSPFLASASISNLPELKSSPTNLYEMLIELLGKPPDLSAELLMKLIDSLDEQPILQNYSELATYNFVRSGIVLSYDQKIGMFKKLALWFLKTPDPEGDLGFTEPYRGNLPFDIQPHDSIAEIDRKMPGLTSAVKDYRYDTDFRPLVKTFSFKRDFIFEESKLCYVTVIHSV